MIISVIQNQWKNSVEENLKNTLQLIDEACSQSQVDFVCLPEFFIGPAWYQPGQEHLKNISDEVIPGRYTLLLCESAKKNKTNLIGGTIVERIGNHYYNTSVYINKEGILIGKASKIHLFVSEELHCKPGNSFHVFDTEFGKVGIAVCSDFWIMETGRMLSAQGAKVIFVPGGSMKQNHTQLIAAAQYVSFINRAVIVMASVVGAIEGVRNDKKIRIEFSGSSLIASPDRILALASPEKQEIISAHIDNQFLEFTQTHDILFDGEGETRFDVKDISMKYCGKTTEIKSFLNKK